MITVVIVLLHGVNVTKKKIYSYNIKVVLLYQLKF